MGSVAYDSRFGLQRPRLRTVALAFVLGYVYAWIVLGVPALVVVVLGLVPTRHVVHPPAPAFGWPFPGSGAWCVAANLSVTAVCVVVGAASIAATIRVRTGRRVAGDRVLLIVAATGVVPLAAYRGVLHVAVPVALAVALLLVYAFAVEVRPSRVATAWATLQRRRRAAVIALLAASAGSIPTSYAVAHPFAIDSFMAGETQGDVFRATFGPAPRSGRTGKASVSIGLHNSGFADATLLAVTLPGDQPPLLRRGAAGAGLPGSPVVPLRGLELGARRTQWIRLIFDVPPCTSATGYLEVTRAIVHYRLLGATFAQSVPLDPRPTIRCR